MSTRSKLNLSLRPAASYISTSLHEGVKLRLGTHGIAAVKPQTIPKFFDECCLKYAEQPALKYQREDATNEWTVVTYVDYAHEVEQAALLLLHLGLQPRACIGILAFNCPEWFYAELGALRAGGVVTGIYPSNSPEAVYHALNTTAATICIVDDSQQLAKVRAVRERLPQLRAVVQLHAPYAEFVGSEEGYYRWCDLAGMQFDAALREELALRERDIYANDCAMVILTSGTVGMPKAVMLSHDAILFVSKSLINVKDDIVPGEEYIVSYLPLSHIAAQLVDIFIGIDIGACVCFADRDALKGTLGKTLRQVRPTCFLGVPRTYEKIEEQFKCALKETSAFSKFLIEKSRQHVEQYHLNVLNGKPSSDFSYWFYAKISNKIKAGMGLDRCKSFFTGSAPISLELKRFLLSIDITLNEAYGMSEVSGVVSLNCGQKNLGSVGRPFEGCEFKISNAEENGCGEICMRSRSNFMGYLNDLTLTKATLKDDGWIYSGDYGYFDVVGYLYVTGRIKELVITAGGENIPPIYIENLIKKELPCISNAMLVGDRKKYLTILLTLKTKIDDSTGLPNDLLTDETINWLKSLDLNYTQLSEVLSLPRNVGNIAASAVFIKPHPVVIEAIEQGIERVNNKAISNAQRIQKFSILPDDFSIASGELGPTLKMRRNIILEKYASIIDDMYK